MPEIETTRQCCTRLLKDLKAKRTTWEQHWSEIDQFIRPGAYLRNKDEAGKGGKKHGNIINSTALTSSDALASLMMSGVTSPASIWFRLTTADPAQAEAAGVRDWLDLVTKRVFDCFAGSNIYTSFHSFYYDLCDMGTGVLFLDEDDVDTIRAYVWMPGTYVLGANEKGQVDSAIRELRMTVRQVVQQFSGPDDYVPREIQEKYDNHKGEDELDVVHAIYPNADYVQGQLGPNGKKWKSCWHNASGDLTERPLRESGYYEFPVMAARWTAKESVYGRGPGMSALGDAKSIQVYERQKARATQKIVDPPMNAPMSMMTQKSSLVPGDVNYVPETGSGQTFTPVYQLRSEVITVAQESIDKCEERIRDTYYVRLALMIAESDRRQVTAEEIRAKQQEKMLMLGPVLERLDAEFLGPVILRVIAVLARSLQLPPPPKALRGQFKIEYLSILAQARKLLKLSGLQQTSQYVGQLYEMSQDPSVFDNLDMDACVTEFADATGVSAKIVRPVEAVAARRVARAKAQAQQRQQEAIASAAQSAKTLSETNTQDENGLTNLARAYPGAVQGMLGGQQ